MKVAFLFFLGLLPLLLLHADEPEQPQIELIFAQSVVDRQPEGEDTVFTPDVGRVYCWTLVTGATDTSSVTHKWFYGETEMASVDLRIGSPRWRTWSYKTILPLWTGRWSVAVCDPRGRVLRTRGFRVLESAEQRSQ